MQFSILQRENETKFADFLKNKLHLHTEKLLWVTNSNRKGENKLVLVETVLTQ